MAAKDLELMSSGVDWKPLAAVLGEDKLRELQDWIFGNGTTWSAEAVKRLGLNAAQWDVLVRSEVYEKYLSMKLGQALEGIIKLDKSQVQSLKLLVEWRKVAAVKRMSEPIDVVAEE